MSKTVTFNMTIDTSTMPPLYTYYNSDGIATNGSVTTACGDPVTVVYTLTTSGFTFENPAITNNFNNDISTTIGDNGKILTIENNAEHIDKVGIQLITVEEATGQKYASPDPKIKSKPAL